LLGSAPLGFAEQDHEGLATWREELTVAELAPAMKLIRTRV
jgi:hypothetical protein